MPNKAERKNDIRLQGKVGKVICGIIKRSDSDSQVRPFELTQIVTTLI